MIGVKFRTLGRKERNGQKNSNISMSQEFPELAGKKSLAF